MDHIACMQAYNKGQTTSRLSAVFINSPSWSLKEVPLQPNFLMSDVVFNIALIPHIFMNIYLAYQAVKTRDAATEVFRSTASRIALGWGTSII